MLRSWVQGDCPFAQRKWEEGFEIKEGWSRGEEGSRRGRVEPGRGNLHFLENDSLGVGRPSERVALEGGTEVGLLEVLVGPTLNATVVTKLARRGDSTWLSTRVGRVSEGST